MSLRRKLLAFLHNRKKTTEYTELAYLESTGTQWIDTGVAFQPIKAVIRLCFNEEQATRQVMGFSSYNTTYFGKTSGGTFEVGGGITLTDSNAYQWQEVEFTHNGSISSGRCELTVDGKTVIRQNTIVGQPLNFWLFNIPNYGTTLACHCKISFAKFYNVNDELIADLIPVLDKDFIPCMYDKVSGRFLYNQGDGEFKWKLPNQLEYLEGDGNQYLLTDYYPNPNTATEVDFYPNPSTAFTNIYGTQDSASLNRFYGLISSVNYKLQINTSAGSNTYYGLDGGGNLMKTNVAYTSSQIRIALKIDNVNKLIRTTEIDNGKIVNYDMNRFSELGSPNCNYPLAIFNRSTAGVIAKTNGYKGRIYSFKIWESGKYVMYLIPVFDEDLTPCMYDLVSKEYFYNKGTGTLKGYFADGSRLVSYLESDGNQYIKLDVIPNDTTGVKAKFYVNTATGKNYVVGSRGNGVGRFYLYSTEGSAYVKYGWGAFYTTNITPIVGTPVEVSLNYLNDRKYIYNGTEVNSNLANKDFSDNTYDMYLFSSNFANVFYNDAILKGRIYSCEITEGDKVIMDLIPVLDKDLIPCMYDVVTEKHFVNQGSGSFTYE